MPRNTPTSNPNRRRSHKFATKGKNVESNDLQGLQAIREAEVSRYTSVKNTDSAYNGHRSRGRGFLKNLVAKREQEEVDGSIDDGICSDVLAKAFDDNGPPNKYSALALEMFIVQKCFNEGCGKDTANVIFSAFAALWHYMYVSKPFQLIERNIYLHEAGDGEKYAGEYTCNEETGKVKGCPACASNVKSVVDSVKACKKSKGVSATRNHAEAMTLEELQRLMDWSTQKCPNEWLTGDDGWRSEAYDAIAALRHRLQHGLMRGFMPSAFTLWTRSVIIFYRK
jgi:hypothetical protein